MDRPSRRRQDRAVRARPRRRWRSAAIGIATAAAVALGSFVAATSAQAVTHTFAIDSLDGTTAARDVTPGDGACRTAAGTCTLLAAIQESNALNLPTGSVQITVADGLQGNVNPNDAARMSSAAVSAQDAGAHFEVTAPVTIDLKNRISVTTSTDTLYALFHINARGVTFLNMTQIFSGETSLVMGPLADGFLLDGGSTVTDSNYFAERFVLFREGAKNITVRNYRIQGFYHWSGATGIFYVNAQNATPIQNVTIDNVNVAYAADTGNCSATDGSGCRTDVVQFSPRNQNVVLNGFSFINSSVANLTDRVAFPFAVSASYGDSVRASNIDISGNSFINVRGTGGDVNNAFITLPYGPLQGQNRISGNEFVRATSGQPYAVAWNGATTSGDAGSLSISGNYFDGYTSSSVYLVNTGKVTVEKNTFGSRSGSVARPAVDEETRNGAPTLVNNGLNANGRITTWYPTDDASVLGGDAPAGTVPAVSPLPDGTQLCLATLPVRAPSTGPYPASPADLDVYWTADRSAEVYLGRASGLTGSTGTLQIALPVGPQEFPTTEVGGTQRLTIVDATTGVAGGYIRLQTQADGASSQYSRIVGFSGSCRPEVTVTQTAGQNDPTLARDLHFHVSSTLPLDPGSVTTAAVRMTAAQTDATIDGTRLNPRTVSVTPVAGTANREFSVVARVDDSARVTADIPAETVRSVGGLTNRAPASGADRTIEFQNPVTVRPSGFTLVTGDASGQQYAFGLRAGAPEVTAPLTFTSAVDAAGTVHQVSLSATQTTIPVGATSSEHVRVTAAAGDVASNTPVVISTTLASADTNYDALVIMPVTARLFSTDPAVRIDKRAYTGVTDTSSPDRIIATGTEALSGARLTDGQPVCFVYTVTNTSSDDWATVLSNVNVTDTDNRLGTNGAIGTIDRLEIGASAQVAACGTLIPVDTTVGGNG
ncbi:hypothetical protein [Microbacterium sp. SORGH_AS_0888]|uniref:hypothetical protein n=1 Tax=Microbacterium sp. SORGH_AS_0888 TaxID=3041791 RepID=UPI0027880BB2|nr:hypothetical protein [Microbacterium sp. SORGH_AS_0888]MDQ1130277.1 hypothetical protein [Microbacterium sp. SORGH_AS_0888]